MAAGTPSTQRRAHPAEGGLPSVMGVMRPMWQYSTNLARRYIRGLWRYGPRSWTHSRVANESPEPMVCASRVLEVCDGYYQSIAAIERGILTFRLKKPSGARKHHIRETENGNHPGDGQLSWPVVGLSRLNCELFAGRSQSSTTASLTPRRNFRPQI